ncbi:HAMP domain-containing sensor histidine kinase [Helicobacter sp. 13S00477-4]|uniref:HAMP domain-containing sensor histidine kinase n=1 Tax=Helicobacter sp. 13S00477-4 TaxID=1905759 RepID=UPI000BA7D89F|nr:HAMP domain-containing sensor histidine kinase [Helicobacter sp. 13S00477-4]PAF52219.1 hypothetical protein BKH44_03710 [Helicobacter sp. 13S00477-4]
MFKIHQLFSFSILGLLFSIVLFLGIFSYVNQVYQDKKIAQERLHTFFEIVDISILEGSFDSKFLKDLQRRSNIGVLIVDKTNQKIYFSDEIFLNTKLTFLTQPIYKKIKINNQVYFILSKNSLIDGRFYDIGIFLPQDNTKHWFFWVEFLALFGVFLILSFGLVFLIKKNTQKELDKIIYHLQNLTKKDFSDFAYRRVWFKEFEEIFQLIQKIAEMLQKQRKKAKKYSKKLRLKYLQSSSIISSLSHELKNPLAIISGYCEAILQTTNKDELNTEQSYRFLNKIHIQSQRLNKLINRLNLAVKLENELMKLEFSTFDLKILLEEILPTLSRRYADKKIILNIKNTEIFADRILIENVVVNLIENALKYSKTSIKIVLKENKFKVIDDGGGLQEDEIKLITKKFYRLEKNKNKDSLGLGLFIVKYILKLHHIQLSIKSKINKGSSFSFEF